MNDPKLGVLLTTVFVQNVVFAAPNIVERTEFYQASGSTTREIAASLKRESPVIQNGERFLAYTDWNVQWQFNWRQKTSGCVITGATTKVEITYTLPQLTNSHGLPQTVKNRWAQFERALLDHEAGQASHGISAAREIEHSLLNARPRETCFQLETDLNKMGHAILDKYRAKDISFDQRTGHGTKTGAVFR